MSEPMIRVDAVFGTVRPAQMTGRWVEDPDGWWRPLMTDAVWYDQRGVEVRREPGEALVRMSCPPDGPSNNRRAGSLSRLMGCRAAR